mmetsp:Transcript_9097/g.12690  ORF Transcript_9097/g.12690 Transcript_9097/m.12690 type:complete len:83 (+) Transcript_9097:1098-1346(+)
MCLLKILLSALNVHSLHVIPKVSFHMNLRNRVIDVSPLETSITSNSKLMNRKRRLHEERYLPDFSWIFMCSFMKVDDLKILK